jgi:hypothetical protein
MAKYEGLDVKIVPCGKKGKKKKTSTLCCDLKLSCEKKFKLLKV